MGYLVRATPEQAEAIDYELAELEQYVGIVNGAVLRRWAFWHRLEGAAEERGLDLARYLPPDIIELNRQQDEQAMRWVQLVNSISTGAAQVLPWTEDDTAIESGPTQVHLGVIVAGTLPLPSPLGVFPLLPVVLIGGGLVVAGVGVLAWLAIDMYLSARKAEAEADLTRTRTQQYMANTIGIAAATDMGRAQALADAYKQAGLAAMNPPASLWGSISQFGAKVFGVASNLVDTVGSLTSGGASSVALWLVGGYFLSRYLGNRKGA